MATNLSALFRPDEIIEYHASVIVATTRSRKTCIALVLASRNEGALILLDHAPLPRVIAAVPLYQDVVTRTTQLAAHAGFELDIISAPGSYAENITLQVRDVEALHALLHAIKKFVALADDLHLYPSGRSHQWVRAYRRPEEGGDQDNFSVLSEIESVSISSEPASVDSDTLVSPTSQTSFKGRGRSNTNQFIHQKMLDRRAEYTDTRNITLKCTTWNMAGKDIVESLTTLLKNDKEEEVTVYCTAFQEMDLSAEAYLTTTDTKAQNYQAYIEGAIGDYYEMIASHQLVGMLLCVYAHKSIVPTISNVIKSYVPCGILGMIGNKGAVGIKFDIMNTSFAVLNCHLAAGQGGSEKRNADLRDIKKRIFNDSGVWDSGLAGIENIIIMGDLNYRIDSTRRHVDKLLKDKELRILLEYDQLNEQRRSGKILSRWQEGNIAFPPTYKFDVGTDLYDTSEKQRIPSWTDRILIKSVNKSMFILENSYTSVPEYYQSDHKPVVVQLRAQVEVILGDKQEAVRNEVFKLFDKHENDAIPSIKVKPGEDELDFGDVYHLRPVLRTFTIFNTGSTTSSFTFSRTHSSGVVCKPWFWPVPSAGTLMPKQEAVIQITACVGDADATGLNAGTQVMQDVLVIHVDGGTDSYVSLNGNWQRTCIGQSLEVLVKSRGVRSQIAASPGSAPEGSVSSIPREIHRICDYLTSTTSNVNLFSQTATEHALNALQDHLDNDTAFDPSAIRPDDATVASCAILLDILRTLSTPVVPENLLHGQGDISTSPLAILDVMPHVNVNVLIYLLGFMKTIITSHPQDAKLRDRLCRVFGAVLIRKSPRNDEDDRRRAQVQQQKEQRHQLHQGDEDGVIWKKDLMSRLIMATS